jgi:hypothetical protein
MKANAQTGSRTTAAIVMISEGLKSMPGRIPERFGLI